ncbi:MAG TPA: response regulator [Elusimicrobiota bacterium]|nr:response regulator [Elusimicrobiota bacterium]
MESIDPVDILLVEDNTSDMELELRALRKHHLADRLHVVRDGAEALDFLFAAGSYAARSAAKPPRVILLDLKLPKLNGLEALRRIKADPRTSNIPVVMLTSSQQQKDIHDCYEAGVNSYIVKPVEFARFEEALSQTGFYWSSLNQVP